MLESIEDAEAGLPEPRGYDDLTPSEQRRASAILGVDQQTLRESMAAADMRAEDAAAADAEANMDAMGGAFDDAFDGEADGAGAAGDELEGDSGAE
jgi:hypothetical protein